MDQVTPSRNRIIKFLIGFVAVYGLLHLAHDSDILGGSTRTAVVRSLQLAGVEAADEHTVLRANHLVIPWSSDCAGFSIFVVLPALTIWGHLHGPITRWGLLRFVLVLPVAFTINVLRILSLVAYRYYAYPHVESLQLHFAMGFFWLIPFLPVFVPGIRKNGWRSCAKTLHIAAVLSILTPLIAGPGGDLVGICTLGLLASLRSQDEEPCTRKTWLAIWTATGLAVGLYRLQSLWIPWLLVCPMLTSPRKLKSPVRIALLLGTVPMFAMSFAGSIFIALALLLEARRMWQDRKTITEPLPRTPVRILEPVVALIFMMPFACDSILAATRFEEPLPDGVIVASSDKRSHRFRLFGQRSDLDLYWFEPGSDRHHTIEVCMKYRNVELQMSEVTHVLTDGKRFYREYFCVNGQFVNDYRSYVAKTLLPLSSPGAHIIVISSEDTPMTATAFAVLADDSIAELAELTSEGGR